MKFQVQTRLRGFTLIEFMVAISIFFIISATSYIPYSHYQKKGLLNQGVKEIIQSIYELRNLSINGMDSGSGNLSTGLYFDTSEGENTSITYFSYPHSFTGSEIINIETSEIKIEKVKKLPKGIQIDSIGGKEKFLIFSQAITGNGSYFYWEPNREIFIGDIIDIDISYKGATSSSLQKQIRYYTRGNIADY